MEYHYNCDDFDDRESAGTARELLMFSWSQVIKIHSYQVTMHTNTCNHSVLTFSIILLFHTWTSVLRNVENLSPHFREMLKLISAGQIKLLVLTLLRVHRTKLRMCLTLLGIGSAPTWIYAPSTQAKHHLVSRKIPASAHVAVTLQARRRIMQRTYVAEKVIKEDTQLQKLSCCLMPVSLVLFINLLPRISRLLHWVLIPLQIRHWPLQRDCSFALRSSLLLYAGHPLTYRFQ